MIPLGNMPPNIKLNDKIVQNTKEAGKYFDGGGLFLHVQKKGGKYWRLKYRFGGKEKLLSFGVYPRISLKKARERREEAKALLAEGGKTQPLLKSMRKSHRPIKLRIALNPSH